MAGICKESNKQETYSLGRLAELSGTDLKGDPEILIHGVATLDEAGPGQLSFLTHHRYAAQLERCGASAVIVPSSLAHVDRALLLSDQPYLALARISQLFHSPPFLASGVHPAAFLGEGTHLGEDVRVGPLAHVGDRAAIGRGTRIYGSAYIGTGVSIGEDCLIYPRAVILDGCRIGSRVIIHSGTVIGADGYGFAQDPQGHHVKIPQVGIVQIDDDVEIGANTTIDRATFGRTWVQRGVKIDNLVMVGHNSILGEHSLLVGQVGISGSTRVGKHVTLAGQVGVAGHLEIGDKVRVGAKSGVHSSLKEGEDFSGIPAIPYKEWLKAMTILRRLPQMRAELKVLREKVREMEERSCGGKNHD